MEIKQKKRSEIADEFKWHLNNLCESDEKWKESYAGLGERIGVFESFKGRLGDAGPLLECLEATRNMGEELGRLYAYAVMKMHEDTGLSEYQGFADMANTLYIKFSSATAFIEPEIIANADLIKNLPDTAEGFGLYKHYLENLLRQKDHVLSAEIEEILANAEEIGKAPDIIFTMLNDADMKFGTIKDEEGNDVEMTHGRFISLMESRDRRVREEAFNTYYDSFWKQKNTIAVALSSSVKKDIFFSKTRKFPRALDSALFGYNIPGDVYMRLIDAVNSYLPEMHRYMRLRKKALGLDELHMYDIYTPIVPPVDTKVSYEEAKKKMLEGLAPLGGEYVSVAGAGLENGWIDVYENEGKLSGAYSWGSHGCHPFILMNYNNKVDDMFTLAHEMGHAMHSYYSYENQPNIYSGYPIFLAEVASTVNEILLMEYLLAETKDPAMNAYLINETLEQFRCTVFRQTMFAEFEMITHDMAEKGEPLTVDELNKIYRELNIKYYGPDMVIDEKIDLEWGRIPHFYNAFYVYQYATGYSAAVAFADHILKDKTGEAVKLYIDFLKSGGSDYAINILKKAGVDMSQPAPVEDALSVFKELLGKMEGLI